MAKREEEKKQMGKKMCFILTFLLTSALLASCNSSVDDGDTERTKIAGDVFATLTAGAPGPMKTPTPVYTPTSATPARIADAGLTATVTTNGNVRPVDLPSDTPVPPTQVLDCLDAAFIADITIPDNTRLDPGQAFVKTWRVVNDGTCPWLSGTRLVFAEGDALGAPAGVNVGALYVGQTTDISVNMTAPTYDGAYRGSWRLIDQDGRFFGTNLTVVIRVGEPSTPTFPPPPTLTDTPLIPTETFPPPTPTLPPPTPPTPSSTPTITPTPMTHSTGSLTIPQTWPADLDEGILGAGSEADIWFHAVTATERYVEPQNGALIARVGSSYIGYYGCAAASLSTVRIHVNDLPAGTYVCVRTNMGRYSQFRVNEPIGPSPGTLFIGYTTWE